MAANEQKTIAMVILGIVAVIAVVGLVLMFVRTENATGEGIYGGAIKEVDYPLWVGRGTPRNMPDHQVPGDLWDSQASRDMTSNWNFYGSPKRNPDSDVPSAMTSCGNKGFKVPYARGGQDLAGYYASRGYTVVDTGGSKPGLCVYPSGDAMVGGIAGQ